MNIKGNLKVQSVPLNACAHPAKWFCGNAHSLGWFDFIVMGLRSQKYDVIIEDVLARDWEKTK